MLLINLSTNINHYKGLISYYFLSFTSSLLFILRVYNITQNMFSFYLINMALTLKFRLYPFSNLLSYVYKNIGYIAFLTISYIMYFQYFCILIIFNFSCLIHNLEIVNSKLMYLVIILFCIMTSIYGSFMFDKQSDIKRF